MTETADVVIIGAGVQGASLAFHLACRGLRPIVVERATVGAGATGRSSGFVRMHYDLEAETRLAWASFPWFREWSERVGGTCGFTRVGFLLLVPPARHDQLRANVELYRRIGVPTQIVDAEEIRRLAPGLAVAGHEIAAYEPESGYADPAAAAVGFLRAARDRGVRYLGGAEVIAIPVAGGRVAGVETTKGTFSAPVVVNAAGAWAPRIASLVDVAIPVSTWRHDTAYLSAPPSVGHPLPAMIDYAQDLYLRPEGQDQVLVGLEDQNELGGSPDRDTTQAAPDFAERVAARLCQRLPAMLDAAFRSAHSGQDGITPDQRPILGPAGPDGFYLDCGHSGTGFKTAPAVGACMSELIVNGAAETADIAPFELGRFAAGRLLVGEHAYESGWRFS